jgi:hypothetical protein
VRELNGELEDALRALGHVVGLALRLVCCGDGSIFYVAVGGRVLGVGRGLLGFGNVVSLNRPPDHLHLTLTSLLAAMMKSCESALGAEIG